MTRVPTRDGAPVASTKHDSTAASSHDLASAHKKALIREQYARANAEYQQRQLHEALMQAPALICVTHGPRHIIETVNDLYLRSIGGRDVVGLPMHEAFPDAPRDQIEALDRAYRTGEPYDGTEVAEVVRTENGEEERYLNIVVQPLKDEEGTVYGLMRHAVDVTELVKTKQELGDLALALERSNKELDSFAYAASHDLRAPLRGIANLAQWIEEDLLGSENLKSETREMLELMRVRMHRMEELIEGLLQYSRAGRVHHEPERVNVGELVGEVVDLLSPPETVVVLADRDMPTIRTERLLLQQVFMNLIGNALKHAAGADAAIEIGCKRVGPFYEFSVTDNGPGIAPEFHDRIWGIFQTLEARDRVEGAGIGLALVKKIVEAQGGRAWVESAPGAGATFRFLWRK
ncbi:MAG TPA: ATP-binding protein [Vicinamibacterales bacterium]|nr:ATP-binding protein [Vicinamibacterales bacterium]